MPAVRQQITVDASSRAVWNALTTEEGVRRWWADEVRLDAREGGRIVVAWPQGEERTQQRGLFHQVQPTRTLEITWDGGAWKGSRLQFQVGGRGEGETKLHVVHSLPEPDPEAAEPPAVTSDDVDRFWREALLRLRDGLEAA